MKKIYHFGFRYEGALAERIRRHCQVELLSLNLLVQHVLAFLGDLYDEGRMDLFEPSRFVKRGEKSDKESTSLILTADRREMLRNLAFTYRISMAEVIRLGLEMYLDLQECGKIDEAIHIYRDPRDLIHTVVVFLHPVLPGDKIAYPLLI